MTPSRTPTQSPPPTKTFTATLDPCDGIDIIPKSFSGDKMEWYVVNSTPLDIFIDSIYIDWPPSHDQLNKVKLDGDTLWDGDDENPPSWMPPWSTGDPNKRKIKKGDTRTLKFEFKSDASSMTYDLIVTFNNGCTLSP
jgi:hypothetical protein